MKQTFQAGTIAFRPLDRNFRILVVSARRTPDTWIFPKGHIESGESAKAAAIRELREEAGIDAVPVANVGYSILHAKDTRILVDYVLAEYRSQVGSEEMRDVRWCSFDEAMNLLSHEYTRKMLRKAGPMIEKRLIAG